jgi:hypothetical protein
MLPRIKTATLSRSGASKVGLAKYYTVMGSKILAVASGQQMGKRMKRIALWQPSRFDTAWLLAILLAALAGTAYAGPAPDADDVDDRFAAPTPFEVPEASLAAPSAEETLFAPIVGELGYALVPSVIPKGFELSTVDMLMLPSNPTGRQIYTGSIEDDFELHITYPMRFPPTGGSLFEHAGFGFPTDALIEIPLADGTGFVIKGGWDPQTLRLELPTEARWDYERSLTVMIAYQMGATEPVWVAVRAEHLPGRWITVSELIAIAEPLGRLR